MLIPPVLWNYIDVSPIPVLVWHDPVNAFESFHRNPTARQVLPPGDDLNSIISGGPREVARLRSALTGGRRTHGRRRSSRYFSSSIPPSNSSLAYRDNCVDGYFGEDDVIVEPRDAFDFVSGQDEYADDEQCEEEDILIRFKSNRAPSLWRVYRTDSFATLTAVPVGCRVTSPTSSLRASNHSRHDSHNSFPSRYQQPRPSSNSIPAILQNGNNNNSNIQNGGPALSYRSPPTPPSPALKPKRSLSSSESAATSWSPQPKERPRFGRSRTDSVLVKEPMSATVYMTLDEAEEFLRMSKHLPVGLAKFTLRGELVWVNEAWLRITGLKRTPEGLANWIARIHPDDIDLVVKEYQNAIQTQSPVDMKWRWIDGRVCRATSGLNNHDPKKATGWIGTVVDITEEERAKEEILRMSEEKAMHAQRAAEEAKTRMQVAEEERRQQELLIDVSSHELRNPVSAIQQNAELTRQSLEELQIKISALNKAQQLPRELEYLLKSLDDDMEAIDAISECASLQSRIANDILGLAQIQMHRFNITPVPFELIEMARKTLKMFMNECKSNGITLDFHIGPSLRRLGPKCRIDADPTRFSQIIVNFLSNAVRFTAQSPVRLIRLSLEASASPPDSEGGIVPPVEVEYHIDEKKPVYLFFSVSDTGAGMSEEATGRVFQKFTQASQFTHTHCGGSGLGLWIARHLCELQRGRVEVLSKLGEGSTFRGFITCRSVDAGPVTHDPSSVPIVENIYRHPVKPKPTLRRQSTVYPATTNDGSKANGPGLRILCCEDNLINRTVLGKQLTKAGHRAVLSVDGKAGFEAFTSGRFDRILMDVEMPVMNGLEATRAIRQFERENNRPRTPIIGLTGNARDAQVQACMKAGMDCVVTKPYRSEMLFAELLKDRSSENSAPPRAIL